MDAQTTSAATTTTTVYAVADSYVDSSNSETNFGSYGRLNVSASSIQAFVYMKFDLSSIPQNVYIVNATLRAYYAEQGGKLYAVPADKVGVYLCSDNSWTEQGINWNNKPSFNSNPTSTWSHGILEYTAYKPWDVTQDVQTSLQSKSMTEVFKFSTKTGDGFMVFDSREALNPPKIDIEYSTTPVNTPTPTPSPTPTLPPPTATPIPPTSTPTVPPLTATPTPDVPTPTPIIPELSTIIVLPLLISLLLFAIIVKSKEKAK